MGEPSTRRHHDVGEVSVWLTASLGRDRHKRPVEESPPFVLDHAQESEVQQRIGQEEFRLSFTFMQCIEKTFNSVKL
jgi:hypothetical protein